jgi:hypothetical protein
MAMGCNDSTGSAPVQTDRVGQVVEEPHQRDCVAARALRG